MEDNTGCLVGLFTCVPSPFLSYPVICLAQGSSSWVSPPMISVLNICKSTRKILYNESTKCLQMLCVEGSAFSVPLSPTVTLVLGRSKGSAEQQKWKHSHPSMRVGFSTRDNVHPSTRADGFAVPNAGLTGCSREGGKLRYPLVSSKPQPEYGGGAGWAWNLESSK